MIDSTKINTYKYVSKIDFENETFGFYEKQIILYALEHDLIRYPLVDYDALQINEIPEDLLPYCKLRSKSRYNLDRKHLAHRRRWLRRFYSDRLVMLPSLLRSPKKSKTYVAKEVNIPTYIIVTPEQEEIGNDFNLEAASYQGLGEMIQQKLQEIQSLLERGKITFEEACERTRQMCSNKYASAVLSTLACAFASYISPGLGASIAGASMYYRAISLSETIATGVEQITLNITNNTRSLDKLFTDIDKMVNEKVNPTVANLLDISGRIKSSIKFIQDKFVEQQIERTDVSFLVQILLAFLSHPIGVISSLAQLVRAKTWSDTALALVTLCSLLGIESMAIDKIIKMCTFTWGSDDNAYYDAEDKASFQSGEEGNLSSLKEVMTDVVRICGTRTFEKIWIYVAPALALLSSLGYNVSGDIVSKKIQEYFKTIEQTQKNMRKFEDTLMDMGLEISDRTKFIRRMQTDFKWMVDRLEDIRLKLEIQPSVFCNDVEYNRAVEFKQKLWEVRQMLASFTIDRYIQTTMKPEMLRMENIFSGLWSRIQDVRGKIGSRPTPVAVVIQGPTGLGKSYSAEIIFTKIKALQQKLYDMDPKTYECFKDSRMKSVWKENSREPNYDQGYLGQQFHYVDDAFIDPEQKDLPKYVTMISPQKIGTVQAALEAKGLPYQAELFLVNCNKFPAKNIISLNNPEAFVNRFREHYYQVGSIGERQTDGSNLRYIKLDPDQPYTNPDLTNDACMEESIGCGYAFNSSKFNDKQLDMDQIVSSIVASIHHNWCVWKRRLPYENAEIDNGDLDRLVRLYHQQVQLGQMRPLFLNRPTIEDIEIDLDSGDDENDSHFVFDAETGNVMVTGTFQSDTPKRTPRTTFSRYGKDKTDVIRGVHDEVIKDINWKCPLGNYMAMRGDDTKELFEIWPCLRMARVDLAMLYGLDGFESLSPELVSSGTNILTELLELIPQLKVATFVIRELRPGGAIRLPWSGRMDQRDSTVSAYTLQRFMSGEFNVFVGGSGNPCFVRYRLRANVNDHAIVIEEIPGVYLMNTEKRGREDLLVVKYVGAFYTPPKSCDDEWDPEAEHSEFPPDFGKLLRHFKRCDFVQIIVWFSNVATSVYYPIPPWNMVYYNYFGRVNWACDMRCKFAPGDIPEGTSLLKQYWIKLKGTYHNSRESWRAYDIFNIMNSNLGMFLMMPAIIASMLETFIFEFLGIHPRMMLVGLFAGYLGPRLIRWCYWLFIKVIGTLCSNVWGFFSGKIEPQEWKGFVDEHSKLDINQDLLLMKAFNTNHEDLSSAVTYYLEMNVTGKMYNGKINLLSIEMEVLAVVLDFFKSRPDLSTFLEQHTPVNYRGKRKTMYQMYLVGSWLVWKEAKIINAVKVTVDYVHTIRKEVSLDGDYYLFKRVIDLEDAVKGIGDHNIPVAQGAFQAVAIAGHLGGVVNQAARQIQSFSKVEGISCEIIPISAYTKSPARRNSNSTTSHLSYHNINCADLLRDLNTLSAGSPIRVKVIDEDTGEMRGERVVSPCQRLVIYGPMALMFPTLLKKMDVKIAIKEDFSKIKEKTIKRYLILHGIKKTNWGVDLISFQWFIDYYNLTIGTENSKLRANTAWDAEKDGTENYNFIFKPNPSREPVQLEAGVLSQLKQMRAQDFSPELIDRYLEKTKTTQKFYILTVPSWNRKAPIEVLEFVNRDAEDVRCPIDLGVVRSRTDWTIYTNHSCEQCESVLKEFRSSVFYLGPNKPGWACNHVIIDGQCNRCLPRKVLVEEVNLEKSVNSEDLIVKLVNARIVVGDQVHQLKDGSSAPIHINMRKLASNTPLLKQFVNYALFKYRETDVVKRSNFIAGIPTGANIISAMMATSLNKNSLLMKEKSSSVSDGPSVEGDYHNGGNVLLVDDVVTYGDKILRYVSIAGDYGLKVNDVLVFIDREQGAAKRLEQKGIKLHSVFTLSEILEVAERHNLLANCYKLLVDDYIQTHQFQILEEVQEQSTKTPIIFVLGGPGSGKSTMCRNFCKAYPDLYVHFSVGDMCRAIASDPSHPNYYVVKQSMEQGVLVPSSVILELLMSRMDAFRRSGRIILIDGFPRDHENYIIFKTYRTRDMDIHVLHLDTTPANMMKHCSQRNRPLDTSEAIESRIRLYQDQTLDVISQMRYDGVTIDIIPEEHPFRLPTTNVVELQLQITKLLSSVGVAYQRSYASKAEDPFHVSPRRIVATADVYPRIPVSHKVPSKAPVKMIDIGPVEGYDTRKTIDQQTKELAQLVGQEVTDEEALRKAKPFKEALVRTGVSCFQSSDDELLELGKTEAAIDVTSISISRQVTDRHSVTIFVPGVIAQPNHSSMERGHIFYGLGHLNYVMCPAHGVQLDAMYGIRRIKEPDGPVWFAKCVYNDKYNEDCEDVAILEIMPVNTIPYEIKGERKNVVDHAFPSVTRYMPDANQIQQILAANVGLFYIPRHEGPLPVVYSQTVEPIDIVGRKEPYVAPGLLVSGIIIDTNTVSGDCGALIFGNCKAVPNKLLGMHHIGIGKNGARALLFEKRKFENYINCARMSSLKVIYFASTNQMKYEEVAKCFEGTDYCVEKLSLGDVPEPQTTDFEDILRVKAEAARKIAPEAIIIVDDTGIRDKHGAPGPLAKDMFAMKGGDLYPQGEACAIITYLGLVIPGSKMQVFTASSSGHWDVIGSGNEVGNCCLNSHFVPLGEHHTVDILIKQGVATNPRTTATNNLVQALIDQKIVKRLPRFEGMVVPMQGDITTLGSQMSVACPIPRDLAFFRGVPYDLVNKYKRQPTMDRWRMETRKICPKIGGVITQRIPREKYNLYLLINRLSAGDNYNRFGHNMLCIENLIEEMLEFQDRAVALTIPNGQEMFKKMLPQIRSLIAAHDITIHIVYDICVPRPLFQQSAIEERTWTVISEQPNYKPPLICSVRDALEWRSMFDNMSLKHQGYKSIDFSIPAFVYDLRDPQPNIEGVGKFMKDGVPFITMPALPYRREKSPTVFKQAIEMVHPDVFERLSTKKLSVLQTNDKRIKTTDHLAYGFLGTKDLLQTQIQQYERVDSSKIDLDLLERIRVQLTEKVVNVLRHEDVGKCSFEHAIKGNTLVNPYFAKTNLDATLGIPFSFRWKKGKDIWAVEADYTSGHERTLLKILDQEGHDLIEKWTQEKLDLAAKGIRTFSIWKNCLKDELRPIEKIHKPSTRLFVCAPKDTTLAFLQMFGKFKAAWTLHREELWHAVGINPHSSEWARLYKKLKRHPHHFDIDFSAFDKRELKEFIWAVGLIIIDSIDRIDRNSTPEDRQTRLTLWQEIIETICVSWGDVTMKLGGNPSGNPVTTVLNCFIQLLYYIYAYAKLCGKPTSKFFIDEFFSNVFLDTFGDDGVVGVSEHAFKFFHFTNLRGVMEEIGQKITLGHKDMVVNDDDIVDIPLEKLTFLKRTFEPLLPGVVAAPLNKDSIYNQFFYSSIDSGDLETWSLVFRHCAMEMALHDAESYIQYKQFLLTIQHLLYTNQLVGTPLALTLNAQLVPLLSLDYEFMRYCRFPEIYLKGEQLYECIPITFQSGCEITVVAGGVYSGNGKGTRVSQLLQEKMQQGADVDVLKIDPYLNISADSLSPEEHGESFVLEDGTVADLDLGNYERALRRPLNKNNVITGGSLMDIFISKQHQAMVDLDFTGMTLTSTDLENLLIAHILELASKCSHLFIELGGTLGDRESDFISSALRKLHSCRPMKLVLVLPEIYNGIEFKTLPQQRAIAQAQQLLWYPDEISVRTSISYTTVEKLSEKFLNVRPFHNVRPNPVLNGKTVAIIGKYSNPDCYLSLVKNAEMMAEFVMYVKPYDPLPEADIYIFGGGFGVSKVGWLLYLIQEALATDKPVFGICLGMQLICCFYNQFFSNYNEHEEMVLWRPREQRRLLFTKGRYDVGGFSVNGAVKRFRHSYHIQDDFLYFDEPCWQMIYSGKDLVALKGRGLFLYQYHPEFTFHLEDKPEMVADLESENMYEAKGLKIRLSDFCSRVPSVPRQKLIRIFQRINCEIEDFEIYPRFEMAKGMFISLLNQLYQEGRISKPVYNGFPTGPDNDPIWYYTVIAGCQDKVLAGVGEAPTKQEARDMAAKSLYIQNMDILVGSTGEFQSNIVSEKTPVKDMESALMGAPVNDDKTGERLALGHLTTKTSDSFYQLSNRDKALMYSPLHNVTASLSTTTGQVVWSIRAGDCLNRYMVNELLADQYGMYSIDVKVIMTGCQGVEGSILVGTVPPGVDPSTAKESDFINGVYTMLSVGESGKEEVFTLAPVSLPDTSMFVNYSLFDSTKTNYINNFFPSIAAICKGNFVSMFPNKDLVIQFHFYSKFTRPPKCINCYPVPLIVDGGERPTNLVKNPTNIPLSLVLPKGKLYTEGKMVPNNITTRNRKDNFLMVNIRGSTKVEEETDMKDLSIDLRTISWVPGQEVYVSSPHQITLESSTMDFENGLSVQYKKLPVLVDPNDLFGKIEYSDATLGTKPYESFRIESQAFFMPVASERNTDKMSHDYSWTEENQRAKYGLWSSTFAMGTYTEAFKFVKQIIRLEGIQVGMTPDGKIVSWKVDKMTRDKGYNNPEIEFVTSGVAGKIVDDDGTRSDAGLFTVVQPLTHIEGSVSTEKRVYSMGVNNVVHDHQLPSKAALVQLTEDRVPGVTPAVAKGELISIFPSYDLGSRLDELYDFKTEFIKFVVGSRTFKQRLFDIYFHKPTKTPFLSMDKASYLLCQYTTDDLWLITAEGFSGTVPVNPSSDSVWVSRTSKEYAAVLKTPKNQLFGQPPAMMQGRFEGNVVGGIAGGAASGIGNAITDEINYRRALEMLEKNADFRRQMQELIGTQALEQLRAQMESRLKQIETQGTQDRLTLDHKMGLDTPSNYTYGNSLYRQDPLGPAVPPGATNEALNEKYGIADDENPPPYPEEITQSTPSGDVGLSDSSVSPQDLNRSIPVPTTSGLQNLSGGSLPLSTFSITNGSASTRNVYSPRIRKLLGPTGATNLTPREIASHANYRRTLGRVKSLPRLSDQRGEEETMV